MEDVHQCPLSSLDQPWKWLHVLCELFWIHQFIFIYTWVCLFVCVHVCVGQCEHVCVQFAVADWFHLEEVPRLSATPNCSPFCSLVWNLLIPRQLYSTLLNIYPDRERPSISFISPSIFSCFFFLPHHLTTYPYIHKPNQTATLDFCLQSLYHQSCQRELAFIFIYVISLVFFISSEHNSARDYTGNKHWKVQGWSQSFTQFSLYRSVLYVLGYVLCMSFKYRLLHLCITHITLLHYYNQSLPS